jgi:hypothetical protein
MIRFRRRCKDFLLNFGLDWPRTRNMKWRGKTYNLSAGVKEFFLGGNGLGSGILEIGIRIASSQSYSLASPDLLDADVGLSETD